jgi:hypothetical protein
LNIRQLCQNFKKLEIYSCYQITFLFINIEECIKKELEQAFEMLLMILTHYFKVKTPETVQEKKEYTSFIEGKLKLLLVYKFRMYQ